MGPLLAHVRRWSSGGLAASADDGGSVVRGRSRKQRSTKHHASWWAPLCSYRRARWASRSAPRWSSTRHSEIFRSGQVPSWTVLGRKFPKTPFEAPLLRFSPGCFHRPAGIGKITHDEGLGMRTSTSYKWVRFGSGLRSFTDSLEDTAEAQVRLPCGASFRPWSLAPSR